MRTLKALLTLSLLLTSLSVFAADRDSGVDRGNGGDEYSKAFIDLGVDLAESLAQHPLPGVSADGLLAAIQATKVNSRDRLLLRGDEVDAINDATLSPPQILLSRAGWNRMEAAPHRRAFLVLHEYLGIMGLDDSRYQISRLLDRANVCERNPVVRDSIESSLRKSCFRIISDDLKYIPSLGNKQTEKSVLRLRKNDFAGLPRLEAIYFSNLEGFELSDGLFDLVPGIETFHIADTFSELRDCSFFSKLPNVKMLVLTNGAGMLERKFMKFVAPGCFAKLKKVTHFAIGIDGNGRFDAMFEGMEHSEALRSFTIHGNDLNHLGIRHLANLPAGLNEINLMNKNGKLDAGILKFLNEKYSARLTCHQSNSASNPEHGQSQVYCLPKQ